MNSMQANNNLPRLSPISRFTVALLVMLTWSGFAFGGEIHDAAGRGVLEKVKALLKANPDLVSSKGIEGLTPLHWPAATDRKDVAELLRKHGGHE